MDKRITKVQELQAIRNVVARGWTQGCAARDANGNAVGSLSPDAVKWCLAGARSRAWEDNARREGPVNLSEYLLPGSGGYVNWNDAPGRTQEEVLAFLDEAIKIEQARASSKV